MTAVEFYHGPLTTDGAFIYSADGNMALMMAELTEKCEAIMKRTCKILNDELLPQRAANVEYKSGTIFLNGRSFLIIRGWGYLTGVGGLNLPPEEAAKIQDGFGEWVALKLSSYDKPFK